ncbi:hypothetical protein [Shewanella algae]|uniref:hypothetical protein n=1 Tax=Shewanella algae TaxID=38313 RepID=UPI0031F5372D
MFIRAHEAGYMCVATLSERDLPVLASERCPYSYLGHSDISITASTYAHLDIEPVRHELGITTAQLLGATQQESKVDKIIREVKSLSRNELDLFLDILNSIEEDLNKM